eukprot:TRINITY_DN7453_c0_g1_i2.p1 TRINITY_DN7453_c0_g1~~TRINITY_DN7453_c0_g1_i2.p1  ORF type:complete len:631 (-),score=132.31 TRINITY_DN7453_c0_g1_i2:71-1963(-)
MTSPQQYYVKPLVLHSLSSSHKEEKIFVSSTTSSSTLTSSDQNPQGSSMPKSKSQPSIPSIRMGEKRDKLKNSSANTNSNNNNNTTNNTNSDPQDVYRSLDQIVELFASETQDLVRIHALILAHEHFFLSLSLFKELVKFFKATNDKLRQFRIVNIIKKWLDFSWKSFADPSTGLGHETLQFMKYLSDTESPLTTFLRTTLSSQKQSSISSSSPFVERKSSSSSIPEIHNKAEDNKEEGAEDNNNDDDEDDEKPTYPPTIHLKKRKYMNNETTLLAFDCEEIARQLTLIDHEIFSRIDRSEMVKTRWLDEKTSPTLHHSSHRINQLAHWFAFQIMDELKPKLRIKMLEHIIKVAMYLLRLQNFNSLMAVYLALNFPSVSNQEQLWKGVKSKTISMWKRISDIMSPNENFKEYRKTIAQLDVPFIPCQEVVLKDLLYHSEVGVDSKDGRIDINKLFAMGKTIDEFRRCQEKSFPFLPFDKLSQLLKSIRNDITTMELDMKSELMKRHMNMTHGSHTLLSKYPSVTSSPKLSMVKKLSVSENESSDATGSDAESSASTSTSSRSSEFAMATNRSNSVSDYGEKARKKGYFFERQKSKKGVKDKTVHSSSHSEHSESCPSVPDLPLATPESPQ